MHFGYGYEAIESCRRDGGRYFLSQSICENVF